MLPFSGKVLGEEEMSWRTLVILFGELLGVLAFPWLLGQAQHPLLTLFVLLLPRLDAIHPVIQSSGSKARWARTASWCWDLDLMPVCEHLKSWMEFSTSVKQLPTSNSVSSRCTGYPASIQGARVVTVSAATGLGVGVHPWGTTVPSLTQHAPKHKSFTLPSFAFLNKWKISKVSYNTGVTREMRNSSFLT